MRSCRPAQCLSARPGLRTGAHRQPVCDPHPHPLQHRGGVRPPRAGPAGAARRPPVRRRRRRLHPFFGGRTARGGAVPPGCPPPSRRNRAGRGGGRPDRRAQRVSLPARNRRRCPGGTAVAGSGADAGNRRIFPDCCIKNLVTAHKIQYNIKAATCRATRSLNETEDLFYETDLRHCE